MKRVLCVVLWWTLVSGMAGAEQALNTDWGFFHALDLTRPGLEVVRDVVAHSDWSTARQAFGRYVRERQTPVWFIDPRGRSTTPSPSGEITEDHEIADSALNHSFTICGVTYQFNMHEIGWNFNPTRLAFLGKAFNPEWTWQFNRHAYWVSLGRAYWETGDERYVQEFVNEMMDWVHRNPPPMYSANQEEGSRWRTLEAGIRMSDSWPAVFCLCLLSPSFTDDAPVTMIRSMAEHARYLMAHPTDNNWVAAEMNGLYTVGVLFPEFLDAETWRTFSAERLRKELDAQVYPDGAQKELAPGYHCVALRYFANLVQLAQRNAGLPLPEGYEAALERMFDCVMYLATPDWGQPPFNDSDMGENSIIETMRTGRTLFPQRSDFAWMATKGTEGEAPKTISYAFPYAGYAIQRSGWDAKARYLAFEGGPFGAGHQHEDKLSFVLTAYGREMVVEGGIYMYDASKWRRYVLGPYAHNVVFVDGEGQQRSGVPETYTTDKPLPMFWRTGPWCDYVRASYGDVPEAFGDKQHRSAIHTRRILFVKRGPDDSNVPGDFWVIADQLSPLDGESHRYEAVFHINAPDVEVNADTHALKTKNPQGPQLGIFPMTLEGLALQVISGQEDPVIQGWLPERNRSHTGVHPIPTSVYRLEGPGMRRILYVFLPVEDGHFPKVSVTPWPGVTGAATAAEITFDDTIRFRLAFPDNAASPLMLDSEPFQGEAYVERIDSWSASIS